MAMFKLMPVTPEGIDFNQLVLEVGQATFTTTATTVEVPTRLTTVLAGFATPKSYTGSAAAGAEVMFCDNVITSAAVTFARKAAADSDASFNYMLIGYSTNVGG